VTAGRLILWRHGRTAHNIAGRIQGSIDIPLDATGRDQVARAAGVLAASAPSAIVASDLSRAQATARALAEITGLTVSLDARLRERSYGEWEGLAVADVQQRWPVEAAAWRRGEDVPSVGMETRRAASTRFVAAVTDAVLSLPSDGTAVVVSHGGVIVAGLTALLGLDPAEWHGLRVMGNARWALAEASPHASPPWRLAAYDVAGDGDPWLPRSRALP
jgi:probable phosphoglycerate mutase